MAAAIGIIMGIASKSTNPDTIMSKTRLTDRLNTVAVTAQPDGGTPTTGNSGDYAPWSGFLVDSRALRCEFESSGKSLNISRNGFILRGRGLCVEANTLTADGDAQAESAEAQWVNAQSQ